MDDLPNLLLITAPQIVVTSLDEISGQLGLVQAGEFRAGNNRDINDSFTGVRIGYPGFMYPGTSTETSDIYNIVGVDADTLQFGLRASDGVAIAGGGNVYLDVEGVNIVQGLADANAVQWWDTGGTELLMSMSAFWAVGITANDINTYALAEDTADSDSAYSAQMGIGAMETFSNVHGIDMVFTQTNQSQAFSISGRMTDLEAATDSDRTYANAPIEYNRDSDGVSTIDFGNDNQWPSNSVWGSPGTDLSNSLDDIELLRIDPLGILVEFGGSDSNARWLTLDTAGVVVNDGGVDRDFRVEGNNDPNLFVVDAGIDRVVIRRDAAISIPLARQNLNTAGSDNLIFDEFIMRNTGGAGVTYVSNRIRIIDDLAGSEDGQYEITPLVDGVATRTLAVAAGLQVGASPTGGDQGAGTINSSGDIFQNSTSYTHPDYVFEHYYTGDIIKFTDNHGADTYVGIMPLADLESFVEKHYHFPQIDTEAMGTFRRSEVLLEVVEEMTLHVFEQQKQIDELRELVDNITT